MSCKADKSCKLKILNIKKKMLTLTKSKILFRNKPLCSFIQKTFHGTYFEGLVCFQGGGSGGRGGYYSLLNTVLEIIILCSTIHYITLHYII